ncbi:TDP-N-acetylfucosamine:lipid II N-acetylfucosaminyltransferase [Halomonas daqiaonensis]|uniref:4-alpha-L-fucosyltransferase glycosyl transferase group 56 n=1 Tax=Halomonas daqiaonensis TaxID=650850 RepID=A0A1H7GRF5_9GAMM|nr:TDP-N-acetylfucosamine:lipid II N-acetylfucosaminyltransferase [Halomonas daqiaonensis]SEK39582.1 4-alpha-L-fucosyltransferase glycosyl transferase group 56 [Halomonas daqiaonensis]
MKILHLATDEKFLDHAIPVFEKVYPGANDVYVFAEKTPLKYVKLNPDYIETKRSRFFYKKPKLDKKAYTKYDLIIFHSLGVSTYPELKNVPDDTPTVWLGWGFDYYNELLKNFPLHLDATQKIYSRLLASNKKRRVAALVKDFLHFFWSRNDKIRAVEKISVFSPVLPEEYELVKKSRDWKCFPKYASWNYGTMEDNLVKGFEGETVTGNAILVGNSATYTGNHADVFDLLQKLKVNDRKVVAPLSYGDPQLAKELTCMGREYFSIHFEPLIDFMPIEDYVSIIKKCGYVIMNHIRQQAVGNIVIMLYLGARVFVRHENPVYDFFKKSGVVISTVQELEADPGLLNQPLTEDERRCNKVFVSDYWSRDKAYERTRELVEMALIKGSVASPAVLSDTVK